MMMQMSAVLNRKCSGWIILHKVWKVLNQVIPHDFHQNHDLPSNFSAKRAFPFPSCVPKRLMLYCQIKEFN